MVGDYPTSVQVPRSVLVSQESAVIQVTCPLKIFFKVTRKVDPSKNMMANRTALWRRRAPFTCGSVPDLFQPIQEITQKRAWQNQPIGGSVGIKPTGLLLNP